MFYLKLAWNNIKTAKNAYAPFVLASFILFSLTCSILLILTSPMRDDMNDAALILPLGVIVLAILSLIMEIYSYNVLLKQRSKEFGLYNILGMNKRQVAWVASLELAMIFLLIVVLGSVFSAVFANFLYLIFVNLIQYDQLILSLSPVAFIFNILLFAGIFFVLELVGMRRIGKTSPLSLFRSQEKGEKEPRGNLILALFSMLFLGAGYGIAIVSKNLSAIAVIFLFFIAVVLVVLGTYLFYISFMAWYLKRKRANKKYFYQPKHFVTTSQMIFRMKQNAAGLASITLLAVMAFVSIGTTVALYVNTQSYVENSFPKNIRITNMPEDLEQDSRLAEDRVRQVLGQDAEMISYPTALISFSLTLTEELVLTEKDLVVPSFDQGFVYIISQDDFKELGNDIPQLSGNQALFFKQKGNSRYERMNLLGKEFEIIENLKSAKMSEVDITYNGAVLVVADEQTVQDLKNAFDQVMDQMTTLGQTFTLLFDADEEEAKALGLVHNQAFVGENGESLGYVQTRQGSWNEACAVFGGLLFTGVLLGLSFLLGAALIIYYKQYSEGQEDKKSYKILQEVGMSQEQVKKTISSQTLMVFFMPLAIAGLHYMVAIPMLRQMLLFFGVTSSNLVYLVAFLTMLVISIIYYGIYRLTSRTYYRIIER